ncbi:IS1167 transposase [Streptococcus pneumoniae]|nr:IS1167 transposase [Streptococcus pneumoniae]
MKSDKTIIRKIHMEQLHFITKLLDIKDPNIKILDIINMDTHKEIIAKLDYEAPSCPDCGSLMKKYDFQKPSKIPYLETTGMPTRILLRKRRFKCYHCSKMMVAETPLVKKNHQIPRIINQKIAQKLIDDFQKPSKIPYLETTGMPTRILLRKRRFKCYHCSKMMVAETSIVKKNHQIPRIINQKIAQKLIEKISMTDIAHQLSISTSTVIRKLNDFHFECNFKNLPEIMSWDVETVRGVTVSIGRWR